MSMVLGCLLAVAVIVVAVVGLMLHGREWRRR